MSNDEYRAEQAAARQHGLKARHELREERHVLRSQWIAQPEDTIGGWCVTLAIPATPAQGNPPIADFCTQEIAEHVARLHNAHVVTDATYTAAEVKVLTEAALRLGRQEAADEIAAALDAYVGHYPEDIFPPNGTSRDCIAAAAMRHAYPNAARIARDIGKGDPNG